MIRQTSATVQFKVDSYFHLIWDDASRLTQIEWLRRAPLQMTRHDSLPVQISTLLTDLRRYFLEGSPLSAVSIDHGGLLDLGRLSEFQKSVYREVSLIPHGETRTYSWVALRTGKPQAARAVGQALSRNPFPVVIPCHRVVSGKNLGGFMGTNDPTQEAMILKSHLIEAERNYLNPTFAFMNGTL